MRSAAVPTAPAPVKTATAASTMPSLLTMDSVIAALEDRIRQQEQGVLRNDKSICSQGKRYLALQTLGEDLQDARKVPRQEMEPLNTAHMYPLEAKDEESCLTLEYEIMKWGKKKKKV
ncbi:hypothetical protein TraAM80_00430 [Trypanosoma rangeli]|uniref:Uncharacterized protein n=1 Tax=Trypanosoma rangeli TaxID=5698 RepID=A0A422P3J7_TRYRA|nr:uncharacterized protein TraAM80_00430 [Trypanosoma rangeli]RNF12282.1 hypothetical protein TraAM80_00430 [Trypanosoma rangeli]|eukprot:RNF12282.1 hypothetical protein TraAM80_00430 [Trypanosoma rangeli]